MLQTMLVLQPALLVSSARRTAVSSSRAAASVLRGGAVPSMLATETETKPSIYFVMGGPGSGKGTQCEKLTQNYGMVHLSAGDLLRAEVKSGSAEGKKIAKIIEEGKIVVSETTVGLLRKAMSQSDGPFLIDGFPRSMSNLQAFEAELGPCEYMLFLEVSEEEMERRLLKRGESSGRSDDNAQSIIKRFRTFVSESMPVIDELERRGVVHKVNAEAGPDEVYSRVCETIGRHPRPVLPKE